MQAKCLALAAHRIPASPYPAADNFVGTPVILRPGISEFVLGGLGPAGGTNQRAPRVTKGHPGCTLGMSQYRDLQRTLTFRAKYANC